MLYFIYMEPKKKGIGTGNNPNSHKGLKPIKPGEVRNPLGAGAHNKELKILKNITNDIAKEVIEISLTGTMQDLEAIIKNKDNEQPMRVGVAKCLYDAIAKGDWSTFERIFERLTGKVPIIMDHTSGGKPLPQISLTMPANTREAPDGTGSN